MKKTRHISNTKIDFFRSGALSAEDTVLCAEHIEVCTECNKRLDNLLVTGNRSRPIILDFSPKTYLAAVHLDYEQLSDYLEDALDEDEAEIVRIHIELCARCRKDLLSLKEFRLLVEPELKTRYSFHGRLKNIVELLKLQGYKRFTFAYPALILICILSYLMTTTHFRRDPSPTQDTVVLPDKTPVKVDEKPFDREKGDFNGLMPILTDRSVKIRINPLNPCTITFAMHVINSTSVPPSCRECGGAGRLLTNNEIKEITLEPVINFET